MESFLSFMLVCSSTALLLSCSVEREYTKIRSEAGNDLTFVHFKTLDANRDSYIQVFNDVYEIDTSLMQMSYLGGQCEVTNKQYWNFLNHLRDQDSLSSFEKHKPKTAMWKRDDSFAMGDSLSIYYDSLELFGNHPVVNITPDDALAYINWLNEIEPDSMVYYRLFNTNEWLELFNDHSDLDIGAGEFSPSEKYIEMGWSNYRLAYRGYDENELTQKALRKEKEQWWKN